MKIPLNRIIAFAGPYISLGAGAVTTWLFVKLNLIGVPGLGERQNELATGLAAAGTWTLTSVLTWLGQSKWLKGHQIQIEADAAVTAAALAPVPPDQAVAALDDGILVDPEADAADGDVSDDVEFGSPPPPDVELDGEPDTRRTPDAP
jgi:hypothetical protein